MTSPPLIHGQTFSPRYYFRDDFEYCIGCTPKAGSTSIGHTARRHKFRYSNKPRPERPTVLVLRHPLDRLVSCYEFFAIKHNIAPGGAGKRFGWGTPFDQFVQYTEQNPNLHWTPQTFQHPDWVSWELLPLEHLTDWWPERFGPVDHRKKTKKRPWADYYDDALRARCEARYAEDIEAYEQSIIEGIHTR